MVTRSEVRAARRDYLRKSAKRAALRSRLIYHRKKGERAYKLRKAYIRAMHSANSAKHHYLFQKNELRKPLRLKALDEARRSIGVMEKGGNNTGPEVLKFIRANGGSGPEAWCGDFMAWCYRRAGSKSVQRLWAAVRALGGLGGIRRVSKPKPGDLVRFNFDHVGMVEKVLGNGQIQTIEGNTGASGAVSDSSTGGDGVYRKRRSTSLVNDYLRVTR